MKTIGQGLVNINKQNNNAHLMFPLYSSSYLKPINISIIYTKLLNTSSIFGYKINLNLYRSFSFQTNSILVTFSDGSVNKESSNKYINSSLDSCISTIRDPITDEIITVEYKTKNNDRYLYDVGYTYPHTYYINEVQYTVLMNGNKITSISNPIYEIVEFVYDSNNLVSQIKVKKNGRYLYYINFAYYEF